MARKKRLRDMTKDERKEYWAEMRHIFGFSALDALSLMGKREEPFEYRDEYKPYWHRRS